MFSWFYIRIWTVRPEIDAPRLICLTSSSIVDKANIQSEWKFLDTECTRLGGTVLDFLLNRTYLETLSCDSMKISAVKEVVCPC